jgi:hypothetical protein
MERLVGMELVDDQTLQDQEIQSQLRDYAEMAWEDLRFDSRLPGSQVLEWPASTGPELVRNNLPPQSLWAPDILRWNALRRRHTWKKLAMQELSAGVLIHELLSRIDFTRFIVTAADELDKLAPQIQEVIYMLPAQAKQARLKLLEDIEKLHLTPVDSPEAADIKAKIHTNHSIAPNFYQDADGDFYAISEYLNEGLKTLLRDTPTANDQTEALKIAKICHNIAVSSAPPDLQTFNTLLAGFKRWNRPNLVEAVIAAFYVHKIRPNEITCREILQYYSSRSHPDNFSRFVAKMRGLGDALMLANPNITVNEASQGRLVQVNEDKIYQKVHPTPMVFGALISGVMKFAGFDRALDIYYEMKADGWGLDVPGLTRLLHDCIRRADWDGGLYVWEEINNIKTKANTRDMTKAYDHMLSLCSVTGNTVAFNQILQDVATGGFDGKMIIEAAVRTTQRAKQRRNLAPAWAADNVLIAVSDYYKNVKPGEDKVPLSFDDEDDAMFDKLTPNVKEEEAKVEAEAEAQAKADPKKAWASWVEHEFGERPKDPEP